MPYVNQTRRRLLDPTIEQLADSLQDTGDLNYAITRLTLLLIRRQGFNYVNASAAMGTASFALMEMYRRVLGPYEDEKIKQNGDVPEMAKGA